MTHNLHSQSGAGAVFGDRRHTPEMALWNLLFLFVLVVGVGCAVSPVLERLLNSIAVAAGLAVAVGVVVRLGCRWVRERAEDRADAAYLAELRAARAPAGRVPERVLVAGRGR